MKFPVHARVLKLTVCFLGLSTGAISYCQSDDAESDHKVRVVEPDKKVARAKPAQIDSERYEIGLFLGMLAVEDFNTNNVKGLSFAYHLSNKWLIQAQIGESTVSRASFEKIADANFLAAEDYTFSYTSLSGGYQLARGRSFFQRRGKYDTFIFLLLGAEQTEFAANSATGLQLGTSYRIVPYDWLTLNLDYKVHIFEREFLDDSKQTLNGEFNLGMNFLF